MTCPMMRVKYHTERFAPGDRVRLVAVTDSGKCFLCADLEDDLKREWLMYWNVEAVRG